MTGVNWDVFEQLPGAPEQNFERLCRALIRRHYSQYGEFKELANQAGVEFHLKLRDACDLGAPPRWFGWQCKWFQRRGGQRLTTAQRRQILESLEKTRKHLPGISDWILWTRHTLTKPDQDWFYDLTRTYSSVRLSLQTSADVESLLNGPALSLRETYFGDLVVTPRLLVEQHQLAVAPIRHRYQGEVHQVMPQEEDLRMDLMQQKAWGFLSQLADELRANAQSLQELVATSNRDLPPELDALIGDGSRTAGLLEDVYGALSSVDMEGVKQLLAAPPIQPRRYRRLLSRLRSLRSESSLSGTNLVADLHAAVDALEQVSHSVQARVLAVLGEAGGGKSELAIRLTLPSVECHAGVLLLGKDLHAGQTLDHLASAFKIAGRAAQSFEQLVEALDAAGQRAGRRIPIIVDGLNESEDPKTWKALISRADEILKSAPYVLFVVTLRNAFAEDCLPKNTHQVKLTGFDYDPQSAIDSYFAHYKIEATDVDLPSDLLVHPLTLRLYCEVANPLRSFVVGVGALPRSMTRLFEAYFDQVAERIADLSPSNARIYQGEVHEALRKLAAYMWENNLRSIERNQAHAAIGHAGSWHTSLLRSLESEGVLVRTPTIPGRDGFAFAYDLMAGHQLAEQLLADSDIGQYLQSATGLGKFTGDAGVIHPLAWDAFHAMAGLLPRRSSPRRQLWEVAPERLRLNALALAIRADPADIDRSTVEQFGEAMRENKKFANLAYDELRSTRASAAHPFDATFLDRMLGDMSNLDRDISWSVWLLESEEAIVQDINRLEAKWSTGRTSAHDLGRARWIKWVLTTNSRHLRDLATRALYKFALVSPEAFFQLAVESLSATDPYIPERMMAAAYGAALCTWSDGSNQAMRATLPATAAAIIDASFRPGAIAPSRHTLLRQYCLGIIELARRIDPSLISPHDTYLRPPFDHLPSPFAPNPAITEEMIDAADHAAIRMDFGNYTIGRLIPDRDNYNFTHNEYSECRKAIVRRMIELGYQPDAFKEADSKRRSYSRGERDGQKIDRFGKKYSWIAFLEMWGWREDQLLLPEHRFGERTSDPGIDPSFPPATVQHWTPPLHDLFTTGPQDPVKWTLEGPAPDYSEMLAPSTVDGSDENWVLLDGFIEETDQTSSREVFSFLRGLLVPRSQTRRLLTLFNSLPYLGNSAIPDEPEHHYKFAGEMPFPTPPGLPNVLESHIIRYEFPSLPRSALGSMPVQMPVHVYAWESHHSDINPQHGISFPSPDICQHLNLRYKGGHWDLFDEKGPASLFRRLGTDQRNLRGKMMYLRSDLLRRYLTDTKQDLVWIIWGERGINYRAKRQVASLDGRWSEYKHLHKTARMWGASAPRVRKLPTR